MRVHYQERKWSDGREDKKKKRAKEGFENTRKREKHGVIVGPGASGSLVGVDDCRSNIPIAVSKGLGGDVKTSPIRDGLGVNRDRS